MNDPKVPNDKRNWESIDIFLFSNGQQYSPPRKYHLRSDELQCWDATINFLAQCHYGTVQSIMELYSLDGRKIEGPLELKNDVAYVAVIPPDAFIPAGYEEYLIKASRSREKRQEQLLNSTAIVKSGENEVGDKNKLDMVSVGNIMENLDKEPINVNTKVQRKVITPAPYKNIGDMVYNENSCETNKEKVFKNNICPTKAYKNKVSLKKRNSPLVNKIERNNKKNHSAYLHNISLPLADMNRNKVPRRQKLQIAEKKYAEPQILQNQEIVPNTEAYTNEINMAENVQSVLIEPSKKMEGSYSNSGKIDFSYNNEIPDQKSEVSPNPIKEMTQHMGVIEKQIQSTFTNKDKQININLNIMFKNYSNDSRNENLLMRCKSNTTLASNKASQINAEVSLNEEIICFEENLVQTSRVSENNVKDKEKVLKLVCKCDSIDTKNMFNEQNKEKSNILFVLPMTNEKPLEGDMHNQEIQTSKKILLHPEEGKRIISEVITDNQDSMPISEKTLLEPNYLVEKSTQMDWCNMLLQTKRHEDGRYTFHLPPLNLLKQYNMNTQ